MSTPRSSSEHSPSGPATTLRFGAGSAALFGVLLAAVLLSAALLPRVLGWRTVVITSGSMVPTIEPGDAVVARPPSGERLGGGTVVVFRDPVRPGGLVTHRIEALLEDGTYRTRGDANGSADSVPLREEDIAGVATLLVPKVGLPQLWLMNGQTLKAAAAAVAAGFLVFFARYGWYRRYEPAFILRTAMPSRPGRAGRMALPVALVAIVVGAAAVPLASLAAFSGASTNSNNSIAAAIRLLYLKTDGAGNRTSVPVLPLSLTAPTVTTLPNYDTNRNNAAGLTLGRSSMGLAETDVTKYQLWSLPVGDGGVALKGSAKVQLWSAMDKFNTNNQGSVTVGLYNCDGSGAGCTLLGSSTVAPPTSWSGGSSTWVLKEWQLGTLDTAIAAERTLRIKVVVNNTAGVVMFAYDTTAYASQLLVT